MIISAWYILSSPFYTPPTVIKRLCTGVGLTPFSIPHFVLITSCYLICSCALVVLILWSGGELLIPNSTQTCWHFFFISFLSYHSIYLSMYLNMYLHLKIMEVAYIYIYTFVRTSTKPLVF